jgi:hypothetical protein
VRALVEAEAPERRMAADVATKTLQAGVSERLVRIAEAQAESIVRVLRAVMKDPTLGMSEAQKVVMPAAIRTALAIAPGRRDRR